MSEQWKDIEGFKGRYSISNKGRIKSYNRKYRNGLDLPEIIIKTHLVRGYENLVLRVNDKQKNYKVHRLIAKAFIPNPNNYSQINHINGIKNDNRIENLEWCTPSENIKHAFKTGLKSNKKGSGNMWSKLCLNINTGIYYESIADAARSIPVKKYILKYDMMRFGIKLC